MNDARSIDCRMVDREDYGRSSVPAGCSFRCYVAFQRIGIWKTISRAVSGVTTALKHRSIPISYCISSHFSFRTFSRGFSLNVSLPGGCLSCLYTRCHLPCLYSRSKKILWGERANNLQIVCSLTPQYFFTMIYPFLQPVAEMR